MYPGLAVEMGALGGVGLGSDAIAAELAEALAGLHPGRTSSEQVTVYGGVGLAFQDVVAAWTIDRDRPASWSGQGDRLHWVTRLTSRLR